METNLGNRAATRQSWSRDAWRGYFNQVKEENPKASERQLCKLLRDFVLDDPAALDALVAYGVGLCLDALEGYPTRGKFPAQARTPATPEEVAERQEATRRAVKEAVSAIIQLNQLMPNGKMLRFCTADETIKFGGGYSAIGKKVKRAKGGATLIGQGIGEDEVRALLGVAQ